MLLGSIICLKSSLSGAYYSPLHVNTGNGEGALSTFLSTDIKAMGEEIELNNTDYNSTDSITFPNLGSITENVTARIVIEYGDFATPQQQLQRPIDLPSELSPRIITEYADTAFQLNMQDPRNLYQTVSPRIIIEYADYGISLGFIPYLGPQAANDTDPPNIGFPIREPSGDVMADQSVTVSVNITDGESGVKNATLQYNLNNGTTWVDMPMTLNLTPYPHDARSLAYYTTIPGQPQGTYVRFRIVAYDFAGHNATRDGVADYCTYVVVPEFQLTIVLPLFLIATLLAVIIRKGKHSI